MEREEVEKGNASKQICIFGFKRTQVHRYIREKFCIVEGKRNVSSVKFP